MSTQDQLKYRLTIHPDVDKNHTQKNNIKVKNQKRDKSVH